MHAKAITMDAASRCQELCERGLFTRAEAFCLELMDSCGVVEDLLAELVKISLRQNRTAQTTKLAGLLRRLFPDNVEGYMTGIKARLAEEEYVEAAEICLAAKRRRIELPTAIIWPESAASTVSAWAIADVGIQNYGHCLNRLALAMKLFPHIEQNYAQAAFIYERNRQFARAGEIFEQALTAFPGSSGIYIGLARASILSGNTNRATEVLAAALERFTDSPSTLRLVMKWQLLAGDYAGARSTFAQISAYLNFETLELRLALDLAEGVLPEHDSWRVFQKHAISLAQHQFFRSDNFRKIMQATAFLAEDNPEDRLRHHEFLTRIISRHSSKEAASKQPRVFPKNLCFLIGARTLPFFESVLHELGPEMVEIVLPQDAPFRRELMARFGLEDFRFLIGIDKAQDYKCVVCDSGIIYTGVEDQFVLGVVHAADAGGAGKYLERVNGIICMCENYADTSGVRLLDTEKALSYSIPAARKVEQAYAGPYHASAWLAKDKKQLRQDIEERYDMKLVDDKPVIFFVEDEVCHAGQIVYCINQLARYCTVFVKPILALYSQRWREKLHPDVCVIPGAEFCNNVLRFGCDYIFASFYSGSAVSSLMLGLPLVCYYSAVYKQKASSYNEYYPVPYENLFVQAGLESLLPFNKDPKTIYLNLLNQAGQLYNLTDTKKIKSALLSGNLKNFYANHLAAIQNKAFGKYERECAHVRAAELIKDFAEYGSFGSNCVSIYFK